MAIAPSPAEPEPLTEDELAALPIFPLPRVVLLPGATLPLHLFEPRYRAMMRDCIEHGPRVVAMAMLAPGWEPSYGGRPAILPIAGVGRIVAHRANADGTFDLVLVGAARARLEELPQGDLAYRRARATVIGDIGGEDEPALRRALEPVLATAASLGALERAMGRGGSPTPELGGSVGPLVDRIADRWVHEAARRQQILEAGDVSARIALVGDALATLLATLSRASQGGSTPPPAN